MPIRKVILYTMTCDHLTRALVRSVIPGQMIMCVICNRYTIITGVQVDEWHAVCKSSRRCHFSHFTGMSEDLANQSADAHYRNTRHDVIPVIFEPNPVAVEESRRWEKIGLMLDRAAELEVTENTTTFNTIRTDVTARKTVKKTSNVPGSMTA